MNRNIFKDADQSYKSDMTKPTFIATNKLETVAIKIPYRDFALQKEVAKILGINHMKVMLAIIEASPHTKEELQNLVTVHLRKSKGGF